MKEKIHPTAIIDHGAEIGSDVQIGPYAVIEDNVVIGKGSVINAGAFIGYGCRIGQDVKIFPNTVIGTVPQDLKFGGEDTTLEIGDRTVIREFATLNRGTAARGKTVIGSDCLLMSYSHVAHDCILGNNSILANSATLAGHVTVEDWVIIGGLVPIHQFVKIGCHAMIGGGWRVPKDVPPYVIAAGDPLKPIDINKIGLSRRGFSEETISQLKKAYKILFRSKKNLTESLKDIENIGEYGPEVTHLKHFIQTSERGVIV
ncbi:MAG: acyl-ACP--UDP-N-acetylglucosamine O-acyltransferase [Candidatus Latescibacteria bacterium]|nr:acyl-ACP--UDP-N-acetylglucosamine O-acyltransferase [Candidatus Latescibacterota bacterium]